jgi:hypothetical protein
VAVYAKSAIRDARDGLENLEPRGAKHRFSIRRTSFAGTTTLVHVRKLKANDTRSLPTEASREGRHELRVHAGTRAVGQHDRAPRLLGAVEKQWRMRAIRHVGSLPVRRWKWEADEAILLLSYGVEM